MTEPDSPTDASAWRGQFADGRSAALHDVRLYLEDDALVGQRIDDDVELFRWAVDSIAWEPLGDDRGTLTSAGAPNATLTVGAALLRTGLVTRAPAPPRSRKAAVLFYGAATIAVAAAIYFNLDPVARALARRVPETYEADLGRGLEALLARDYCESAQDRAVLQSLATRLGGAPRDMHVLDSDMVNAFTFPGGIVIVTRGLLSEAKNADEVAGVLAHELEHVHRRHVMIRFVRGSLLTALWQLTVGDYAGLFVVDPKTAFDIASLRFSRDDEREADHGAVARLSRAGISSEGLRAFFERLRAQTDVVPPWLSNHPATAERIDAIGTDRGGGKSPLAAALPAAEWAVLQRACGGTAPSVKSGIAGPAKRPARP